MPIDWIALVVFILLFAAITILGFVAVHWRRGDLALLHEWGLAGGRFGTVITWFLLGGDLYTAYTFIAVPALMFGAGAIAFFAVPYTVMVYPFVFVVFPRLWSVARRNGYITASDFVRGRYGSRWLALAIAVTGIVATMPYIALQLVGIQVVIAGLGVQGVGWVSDLPLVIAFVILAAFTYTSGLRAPAAIAIVKDTLIWITVIAAVIVVPIQLGGYDKIFAAIPAAKLLLPPPTSTTLIPYSGYWTLALGSALALFLYPHAMTGVLSASSRGAISRNAALLPAYSFLLALIALLGFMALAAGVDKAPQFADFAKAYPRNFAVPALFIAMFPSWFVGVAFAAIAIGALVPAAIMSIAAANLWTRNIYREFINPTCTPAQESQMAKWVSLIVKFGALVFIVFIPLPYAINLQLLGGILIIQTLPSVVIGLYTRWFHPLALVFGWLIATSAGTWMFFAVTPPGPTYPLAIFGWTLPCYTALSTLVLNFAVAIVLTPIFSVMGAQRGHDETQVEHYV
ncbi:MAG TPA: sodium:solute symporter [Stellaceae bacterium]|nr:sodium:solute symporter [Stellaceae bacterium]